MLLPFKIVHCSFCLYNVVHCSILKCSYMTYQVSN